MEFNRIIKLLRKERGITQKQAAEDLGVSQALLSHYEKGIRECGLDFVVRVADYYNVSCDYLLGRSAERNGMMLNADDLPNPDKMKDNVYHGSVLPTMNKKLISNSLNVLYAKILGGLLLGDAAFLAQQLDDTVEFHDFWLLKVRCRGTSLFLVYSRLIIHNGKPFVKQEK